MDIFSLLRHFASEVDVPINPNDVKQIILSDGRDLVVRFIGVQLDTGVLRGHLAQYVKKAPLYGEDTNIADVYYAINQSSDWIRLVCIKELLHIFDAAVICAGTKETVLNLIKRMALSPEFYDLSVDRRENAHTVISDKLTVLYACAVTFPWATRALILPKIADGTMNEADVVRMLDIPQRFVRLVLSDIWEELYAAMLPTE